MLKTRAREARMNAPATRPVMYGYRTMSTLHCSSISLGYMKPCTPGIIAVIMSPLPHRSVEIFIEDLRPCRHLRLQHLHVVRAQKFVHRVGGVLQIRKLARAGGTRLAARRGQAFGDAVITERALARRLFHGIEKAASVRAGLDTVAAADTVFFVDQNHAVGRFERGSNRAGLHAR